jgi:hypothetical protein
MNVVAEIKKRKIPIVRVDNSLDKYDDKILFPVRQLTDEKSK